MNKQVLIATVLLLGVVALLLTVIGRAGNVKSQPPQTAAAATTANLIEEENATEAGEDITAGIRRDAFVAAARAPRAPALSQGTWIRQRGAHPLVADFDRLQKTPDEQRHSRRTRCVEIMVR